jgi:Family of unknown function (DUF6603)
MTLAEVFKLLHDAVQPDGRLLLKGTMFPELASVLRAFALPELEVRDADVRQDAAVTVDGRATMAGTKEGGLRLEVTEASGSPELIAALSFTAPPGWGFADGFPGLPESYGPGPQKEIALVTLGDSLLYKLPLDAALLTATSGNTAVAFDGVLADRDYFGVLVAPLKIPAKPRLTGKIQIREHAFAEPDLVLAGEETSLSIGSFFTLDGVGFRAHAVEVDPSTGGPLTRMDLVATLEVGKTDPVPITLAGPVYSHTNTFSLTADFGKAGLSIARGATAFAELVGLPVGDFALPKPLDVLASFALQEITSVVTLDPAGVQLVAITVGPGKNWPIADGIEVRDLTVGWSIRYPFQEAARSVFASIIGRLSLGTVEPRLEFDVFASTENGFAASGSLARPITLEQMATTINGSPVPGLPDLEVIEAGVSADTAGNFGVAVSLGNWHVGDVAGQAIMLYEVSAALTRRAGVLEGQFLAVFGVGKARLYVATDMRMGAAALPATPTAASTSWVFKGGTQPKTSLDIGDLLGELGTTFGISEVPAPIRSLKLTALDLTYKTANSEFNFLARAEFVVDVKPVQVMVTVDVAPTPAETTGESDPRVATVVGSKGYSANFAGKVTFAGLQFDLVFDTDSTRDVLVADYVHTGEPTKLRDLVAEISSSAAEPIPEGIRVDLEEVKFVFLKQTETRWAFGLRLGTSIALSELPIVGSKLPAAATLSIDNLQVLYASADFTAAQTKIINPVLPAKVAKLPEAVGKGVSFDADLKLGTVTKHLHAGVRPPLAAPALPPPRPALEPAPPARELESARGELAPSPPASSTDPVKWVEVNKQFGIFSFERVGVGYQNNVLEFALDASVALGPLAFSMQGLSVGSPLDEFDPRFGINGLALTFNRPPLSIGGAFLKVKEKADGREFTSYYGEVIVQATRFGLQALGGWAPDRDPAMFFIYLSIKAPIGGPPALYVTRIAGGFGINSALVLPTIAEVEKYPLLPAHAPPQQGNAAETIKNVIPKLQKTFRPQPDQYWVAAGIELTSFEMVKAQAVVSVAFGVALQIGVVGTCSMAFPTTAGDAPSLAYVEIDVVASFTPSTGLLAVDGKLSPASYLYGGFVKLTGGFASYTWFGGDHQGDFVVSLGGYHPAFTRPKHYPVVPRLGLSFSLGPIRVAGQAYFALTPGAFMAGMRMSATFSAGPIDAWFDAGIDFMVRWGPFQYEATAWVTIGCAVDLGLFTLRVQVGANLQIWGPALGGTAYVDLDVVSFTIAFGAKRAAPLPVGWKTFAASFLPPPPRAAEPRALGAKLADADPPPATTNVIQATVVEGLLGDGPADVNWIVDPDGFRIRTDSTVPANHGVWATGADSTAELPNVVADYARVAARLAADTPAAPPGMQLRLDHDTKTFSDTEVWAPRLNIAPMEETGVASYHTIALRKYDTHAGGYADYQTNVAVTPQLRPSNTALWGVPVEKPAPNAERLIEATLCGFAISPPARKPERVSDVSLLSLMYVTDNETGFDYQRPVVDGRYEVKSSVSSDGELLTIHISGEHTAKLEDAGYVLSSINETWVADQRTRTLDELRRLGFSTLRSDEVHLTDMAKVPLTDWPSVGRIGAPR